VSQLLHHFHGPPLDLLQQLYVFAVLRAPELDAGLQVGSHQSGAEGQNHLPRPAGHASSDAAQGTVGLLGCGHTLLAHVQLFIHRYPQVLLLRAALSPFIPQSVLMLRIALSQEQGLALCLVESHEVCKGPFLQPVKVSLDGIPSLQHTSYTAELGVIHRLAEDALSPTICVINEDNDEGMKQYQS